MLCLLDSDTCTSTDTEKLKPDSHVQPFETSMEDYMVVYASHPGKNSVIQTSLYHNNSNSHRSSNLK